MTTENDGGEKPNPEPQPGFREFKGRKWYWVPKKNYNGIPDPTKSVGHKDEDGVEWWLLQPDYAEPKEDWFP